MFSNLIFGGFQIVKSLKTKGDFFNERRI
jgi:hypothetical protein